MKHNHLFKFILMIYIALNVGCSGTLTQSHGANGIQISAGMDQAKIDEQAQEGQMRNIR
ncbi:MAG: hypothetical protein JSS07_09130 [Proteobacteria bacterium]|nr:hypothetical protein [Pseudomonadota bacterium]